MILTVIFSLFSSILIGLAPCNSNCAALDQENTIEVKTRDNMLINYGYNIASVYEIFSRNELYNSFVASFYNATTQGFIYSTPYLAGGSYYVNWQNLDKNNPDRSVSNYGVPLTNAYFELSAVGSSTSARYQNWDLYLIFDNTLEFKYVVEVMYDNSSTDGGIISVDLISQSSIPAGYSPSYFIVCRSGSYLYNLFIDDDYTDGYNVGYQTGYNVGYEESYDEGVERGKEIASDPASDIYENTYNTGYNAGYQIGRSEGIADASASSGVPALIFTGILNVALLPVDIFLQMFQYEVFGINIAGLISGLLTVCMVIVIIRFLFGGKNGGNNP